MAGGVQDLLDTTTHARAEEDCPGKSDSELVFGTNQSKPPVCRLPNDNAEVVATYNLDVHKKSHNDASSRPDAVVVKETGQISDGASSSQGPLSEQEQGCDNSQSPVVFGDQSSQVETASPLPKHPRHGVSAAGSVSNLQNDEEGIDASVAFLAKKPTDLQLGKLAEWLATDWVQFALNLGIPKYKINTFRYDHAQSVVAQRREMLFSWRQMHGKKATNQILCDQLKSIDKEALDMYVGKFDK